MAGNFRNPVARGDRSEMLAAAEIISIGGTVAFPFGRAQGYDLISDLEGQLNRLQVKTAWYREDYDRCDIGFQEIETVYEDERRRQRKIPCSGRFFDFLVISAGSDWYVIPSPLLVGRSSIVLRPPSLCNAGGGKPRQVFDPEAHLDAWSLLKGMAQ